MLRPVLRPILQPILRSPFDAGAGVTVGGLYAAMTETSQPMPGFVEGWAANSFHGQTVKVPNGVASISADSEGERILNLTVTGAAGATTLTGSGFDATNGTGSWSCTVLHDDGTYGVYTAYGITTTSITVHPPLRAAATSQPLASLGGALNGQHYGLQGYKALARRIFAATKRDVYRNRYAAKWTAAEGARLDWSAAGGFSSGQYTYGSTNQFFTGGDLTHAWLGRSSLGIIATGTVAPHTGKGVAKSFDLGGATGVMEAFFSVGVTNTGVGVASRAVLVVDGVTVLNQPYPATAGLVRVLADYTNATTATLTISRDAEEAVSATIRVGDVTFWAYDRAEAWTDPAIDKNKNVVVMGDSWSARYSGGLGLELQAAITAAGGTGTVSTVATGGQTAEDGLARFDADVAPLLSAGDTVVVEYFVNDRTAFGETNYNRWLLALYKIGRKCQAIGARPLFVMPLPTQSITQSAGLGVWAEKIGAGLPV